MRTTRGILACSDPPDADAMVGLAGQTASGKRSPGLVAGGWPPVWREALEERAAIMEFDGGLSREEAEYRAEACTRSGYERIEAMLRVFRDESSAG